MALILIAVSVALAWAFPRATVIASLFAAALHAGIFIALRIEVGSLPVSSFDLVPALLLISAIALRGRTEGIPAGVPQPAAATGALFAAGLVLGPLVGLGGGADFYELLKVLRIELGLICVFAAAVIGAPVPQWRRAVITGLILGGVLAAIQFIVGYLWYEVTGRAFWALFPFADVEGLNPDPNAPVSSIGALKTVYVSIFLLFPALCVGALGLTRWSRTLMALMLVAAFFSLFRGAWAGSILVLGTVFIATMWSRDIRPNRLIRMGVLALPVLAIAAILAGGLIQSRIDTSFNEADISGNYRLAESKEAIGRLTADPVSFVTGEGMGVAITHEQTIRRPGYKPSARLENNVLARWTNLTLFSLIASILLFFGAALRGFRELRSGGLTPTDTRLSVASLCLPAVWVGGLYGGSLLFLQVSLPFWLLGGTMLGWIRRPGEGRDDAR